MESNEKSTGSVTSDCRGQPVQDRPSYTVVQNEMFPDKDQRIIIDSKGSSTSLGRLRRPKFGARCLRAHHTHLLAHGREAGASPEPGRGLSRQLHAYTDNKYLMYTIPTTDKQPTISSSAPSWGPRQRQCLGRALHKLQEGEGEGEAGVSADGAERRGRGRSLSVRPSVRTLARLPAPRRGVMRASGIEIASAPRGPTRRPARTARTHSPRRRDSRCRRTRIHVAFLLLSFPHIKQVDEWTTIRIQASPDNRFRPGFARRVSGIFAPRPAWPPLRSHGARNEQHRPGRGREEHLTHLAAPCSSSCNPRTRDVRATLRAGRVPSMPGVVGGWNGARCLSGRPPAPAPGPAPAPFARDDACAQVGARPASHKPNLNYSPKGDSFELAGRIKRELARPPSLCGDRHEEEHKV
ncbi:Protein of unknown function [Gryllus bimaculatus]|nr:Protein of unknown function [Gryllus bimaculatus]